MTVFPNKVTSEVFGARTQTYLLGEHNSTHNYQVTQKKEKKSFNLITKLLILFILSGLSFPPPRPCLFINHAKDTILDLFFILFYLTIHCNLSELSHFSTTVMLHNFFLTSSLFSYTGVFSNLFSNLNTSKKSLLNTQSLTMGVNITLLQKNFSRQIPV